MRMHLKTAKYFIAMCAISLSLNVFAADENLQSIIDSIGASGSDSQYGNYVVDQDNTTMIVQIYEGGSTTIWNDHETGDLNNYTENSDGSSTYFKNVDNGDGTSTTTYLYYDSDGNMIGSEVEDGILIGEE